MKRIYVGVDPGLSGAVAVLYESGAVSLFDTPTYQVEKAKKKGQKKAGSRTMYDVAAMADIFRGVMAAHWDPDDPCPFVVGLEHQQPMPNKMGGRNAGANQTFSLGYGYGIWVGVLTTLGLSYELIRPATWKPKMMGGLPKEKEAARVRACSLFPGARGDMMRKKDHGRAEALLMAEYLRRQHSGLGAPTAAVEDEGDEIPW